MFRNSPHHELFGLVGWLVVAFLAAGIGAAPTVSAGPFYLRLARSPWASPPSVFGPVSTLLYAAMAIAAWLVWREGGFGAAGGALSLFLFQLAFNALWSWLFFGWHRGALALADSLLLWTLIAATLVAFWRVRPPAGALLVPYLLWVTFAAWLNYAIWQLNPRMLG